MFASKFRKIWISWISTGIIHIWICESNVQCSLRPPGGKAWDGVVRWQAQPDILRKRREDRWERPHMGTRHPNGNSSYVPTDAIGEKPRED